MVDMHSMQFSDYKLACLITLSQSAELVEQDGQVAHHKIYVVPRLVGCYGTEVLADDAVPVGARLC